MDGDFAEKVWQMKRLAKSLLIVTSYYFDGLVGWIIMLMIHQICQNFSAIPAV